MSVGLTNKVAVICDTHFGARADNPHFLKHFEWFYREVFFPVIDDLGIKQIIHGGDIVDRRKFINYVTANRMRQAFIEPIKERGISVDFLVGNHDAYFRDRNDVNALTELVDEKGTKFRIHENPTEIRIGNVPVLMVPWICDANREQTLRMIDSTAARICIGHLELAGFESYRGHVMGRGMDAAVFNKFEMTLSGHYHHPSIRDKVHYLGAPYEMTWSDYNCPRGFWIFDARELNLEFVKNPEVMHKVFFYDDAEDEQIIGFDFDAYVGKVVKIIVQRRHNHHLFDSLIDHLEKVAADVQVVEEHMAAHTQSADIQIDNVSNPFDVLMELVGETAIEVDRGELGVFMRDLYQEAARAGGE